MIQDMAKFAHHYHRNYESIAEIRLAYRYISDMVLFKMMTYCLPTHVDKRLDGGMTAGVS